MQTSSQLVSQKIYRINCLITLPLPYLLHISQCDGLCLVASIGPAVARVSSDAGNPGGRLSQSVEQRHLFCQAEGAEVRLFLTLALALALALALVSSLHCRHRLRAPDFLGTLNLSCLPHLLPGGGALLRGRLQAEGGMTPKRQRGRRKGDFW